MPDFGGIGGRDVYLFLELEALGDGGMGINDLLQVDLSLLVLVDAGFDLLQLSLLFALQIRQVLLFVDAQGLFDGDLPLPEACIGMPMGDSARARSMGVCVCHATSGEKRKILANGRPAGSWAVGRWGGGAGEGGSEGRGSCGNRGLGRARTDKTQTAEVSGCGGKLVMFFVARPVLLRGRPATHVLSHDVHVLLGTCVSCDVHSIGTCVGHVGKRAVTLHTGSHDTHVPTSTCTSRDSTCTSCD